MLRAVLPWALAALCVIAIHAAASWCRHRRYGRRFCPGPALPFWRWILPWEWLRNGTCLYDLSGLPHHERGTTCPECGRILRRPRYARLFAYRWRWTPITLLFIATGFFISRTEFFRTGAWAHHMPAMALVTWERALGTAAPGPVRREVATRIVDGNLSTRQAELLIPRLVTDLRRDAVRGNGERAIDLLERLGPPSIPYLEAALNSTDWQQRQLAAHILRRIPTYLPSDTMFRVTVEGLQSDDLPGDRSDRSRLAYTYVFNARDGFNYLIGYPDLVAPHLKPGLASHDAQQRLLCAAIAGFASQVRVIDLAAPILIEHLEQNNTDNDAMFAVPALFHFGAAAIPFLEPHADSADPQRRELVRFLLRRLGNTSHPPPQRSNGPRITSSTTDPTTLTPSHLSFTSFE